MVAENLRLVTAKYMLDAVGTDAIVSAATNALMEGVDSPSLRQLAGMNGADSAEVRAVFRATLRELQIESPTPREAAMLVATEIAMRITRGVISPYDGAKEIWQICAGLPEDELRELDPFVYAASEWEERPKDRDRFAAGILGAAHDLVHAAMKGTPCETAIEEAMRVARQILTGDVDVFEGGRRIATLGSGDCFDFINEVDAVDEMAGFWLPVNDPEHRRVIGLHALDNAADRAEEIRRAARDLIDRFGGG